MQRAVTYISGNFSFPIFVCGLHSGIGCGVQLFQPDFSLLRVDNSKFFCLNYCYIGLCSVHLCGDYVFSNLNFCLYTFSR